MSGLWCSESIGVPLRSNTTDRQASVNLGYTIGIVSTIGLRNKGTYSLQPIERTMEMCINLGIPNTNIPKNSNARQGKVAPNHTTESNNLLRKRNTNSVGSMTSNRPERVSFQLALRINLNYRT